MQRAYANVDSMNIGTFRPKIRYEINSRRVGYGNLLRGKPRTPAEQVDSPP
jgi:hypothetical protein